MTRATLLLAIALALTSSMCGLRPADTEIGAPDVDRTLTTHSYIEEGELVTFIVDVRATRERQDTPFVPFELAIGNRGLNNLSLTRESFTLIDEKGNRYPCIGPRDLLAGYDFLDFDRKLGELPSIVTNKFGNFTRYPSMFSPVLAVPTNQMASTVVRDAVSIPRFGYIIDFIYFPRPVDGVMGKRLELFLEAPELQDPIFVKFLVR